MAVNVPNPGLYFALLGQHCVALREAVQDLLNDAAYLNAMGGATFLEAAPFNLAAADATAIMNTIGAVSPAASVVTEIQNFIESTEPLWGGQ